MGKFYFKGQEISQNNINCPVAIESNNTVTDTAAFFENWIKYYYPERIGIDGNLFSFTGASGWEIVGCKLGCVPNTTNTIRFKVVSATINGGALRAGVRTTPPDIDGDVSFISYYDITGTGDVTITFNPGNSNIIYLVFNGGHLSDGTTHYFTFDFSKIRKGMARISGVTDANYHLVSDDGNSDIALLKNQDVFEGRLKVDGNVQRYCYSGLTPRLNYLGGLYSAGTYYLWIYKNGLIQIKDGSGNVKVTLSEPNNKRYVFTFTVTGGGGGGAGGKTYGLGGIYGGGGGGGGGTVCFSVYLDPNELGNDSSYCGTFQVGSGGSGGGVATSGGAGGESNAVIYGRLTARGYGGEGGVWGKNSAGGAGGLWYCNNEKALACIGTNGAAGGNRNNAGGSVGSMTTGIWSINSTKLTFSGRSGGSAGGTESRGGGGGASLFANGGNGTSNGSNGSGGGGGGASFGSDQSGNAGGTGDIGIWY